MNDGLIGWNFPNIVSLTLMGAIIWAALGLVSHVLRGNSTAQSSAQ